MLCQICKQNEATIHLTEIVNNNMVELHICESCAKEKSVDISLPVAFKDVLSGLVDFSAIKGGKGPLKVCSNCGISYDEFKSKGRLGCRECYESFRDELLPLIKGVHGALQHFGIRPSSFDDEYEITREIDELNIKLKRLVELEEFEDAAHVRDKIKMLVKKREEIARKNGNDSK